MAKAEINVLVENTRLSYIGVMPLHFLAEIRICTYLHSVLFSEQGKKNYL